jgi:hypothetical protein
MSRRHVQRLRQIQIGIQQGQVDAFIFVKISDCTANGTDAYSDTTSCTTLSRTTWAAMTSHPSPMWKAVPVLKRQPASAP